jgi:hypothetical protein
VSDAFQSSIVRAQNDCVISQASFANNQVAQSYTDLTEGYLVLLVLSVSTLVDLFAKSSLLFKAVCVALEIGLFTSEVLSTFHNHKLVLATE